MSYHLTQTDVQLFSSRTYHHIHSGYYEVYYSRVSTYLTDRQIRMHIDREQKNLPVFYNSLVLENKSD